MFWFGLYLGIAASSVCDLIEPFYFNDIIHLLRVDKTSIPVVILVLGLFRVLQGMYPNLQHYVKFAASMLFLGLLYRGKSSFARSYCTFYLLQRGAVAFYSDSDWNEYPGACAFMIGFWVDNLFVEIARSALMPRSALDPAIRINLLSERIRNENPSVIALQEVWGWRNRLKFSRLFPEYTKFDDSSFGYLGSGLMLLVRKDLTASPWTTYYCNFTESCGFDRCAQKGLLVIENQDYVIATTHLQEGINPENVITRNEQGQQLALVLKTVQSQNQNRQKRSLILCGDFNGQYAVRTIAEELGLNWRSNGCGNTDFGNMQAIDAVLVSKNLQGSATVNRDVTDGLLPITDHALLTFEMISSPEQKQD